MVRIRHATLTSELPVNAKVGAPEWDAEHEIVDLAIADVGALEGTLAAKAATADLASTDSGKGADLVGFIQSGTGAVARTVTDKARETISVLDFGADPTGVALCDTAFANAKAAAQNGEGGGTIYVPQGVYLVSDLPLLDASGLRIEGDSRFTSRLKVQAGATGSILYNPNAGANVSGLHRISDLYFDLNGQNVTAIDLSSVNNSRVEGVRFTGGTSFGTATGVGVLCAAPIDSGSYTNKIVDCDATYMARAFVAQAAANENTFDNCEATVCVIGFDVVNGVDTARIIGGRAEGCTTGLRTGGRETVVLGCRFEANTAADVEFEVGAERHSFVGCYTASSPVTFLDEANCTGLLSVGGTFPRRDTEPNLSNPMLISGRTTFAAAGSAPEPSSASTDYSAVFQDYVLIGRDGGIEFENGTAPDADNRVLFANVDSNNRVSIPGFDRKAGAYTRIFVGPNFNFNPNVGLEYAGNKVLAARKTGWATATGTATRTTFDTATVTTAQLAERVKALIDDLHATAGHGIIGT